MNFFKSIFGTAQNALSATEAQALIAENKDVVVLDVREPDEFRSGHINGAKLIPLGQISSRLNELPKDKTIICVCRSGARSGAATRQLHAEGYQALNLRGGMSGWQGAGLPVKKGK